MDKWKKDSAVMWAQWRCCRSPEVTEKMVSLWLSCWEASCSVHLAPWWVRIWPPRQRSYVPVSLRTPACWHLAGSGGQTLLSPLRLILYHQSGLVGNSAASGTTQPVVRSYCQLPCYFCSLVIVFGFPQFSGSTGWELVLWSRPHTSHWPNGWIQNKVQWLFLLPWAR